MVLIVLGECGILSLYSISPKEISWYCLFYMSDWLWFFSMYLTTWELLLLWVAQEITIPGIEDFWLPYTCISIHGRFILNADLGVHHIGGVSKRGENWNYKKKRRRRRFRGPPISEALWQRMKLEAFQGNLNRRLFTICVHNRGYKSNGVALWKSYWALISIGDWSIVCRYLLEDVQVLYVIEKIYTSYSSGHQKIMQRCLLHRNVNDCKYQDEGD